MDTSEKIESEMIDAKNRINQLIVKYKYNTDDYNAIGMIRESDALVILDGVTKIIRKTLESVVKDYKIGKKQTAQIDKHINDIKANLKHEISDVDILPEGCGVYVDEYGIGHERDYDDVYRDFEQKLNQAIKTLDVQKLRLDNYRIRKVREARYNWLPIVISFVSLAVSIMALIVQILKG